MWKVYGPKIAHGSRNENDAGPCGPGPGAGVYL
jgi:hypothetical protein